MGQQIVGTIAFGDETHAIYGEVVRIGPGVSVGVSIDGGISQMRVMAEQRRLIERFPSWRP